MARASTKGNKNIYQTTRERILTIRLLEKVKEHPAYTRTLGIEVEDMRPHFKKAGRILL